MVFKIIQSAMWILRAGFFLLYNLLIASEQAYFNYWCYYWPIIARYSIHSALILSGLFDIKYVKYWIAFSLILLFPTVKYNSLNFKANTSFAGFITISSS